MSRMVFVNVLVLVRLMMGKQRKPNTFLKIHWYMSIPLGG